MLPYVFYICLLLSEVFHFTHDACSGDFLWWSSALLVRLQFFTLSQNKSSFAVTLYLPFDLFDFTQLLYSICP